VSGSLTKTEIITILKDTGEIPSDVMKELHLLIMARKKEGGSHNFPMRLFKTDSSSRLEKGCFVIEESRFEEMYRCYMSEDKAPALTFSEYLSAMENIFGIRAA